MIPSGNVVSVVSCCSSVLLAYVFASESIKFEQPSIGLGFRLRVLLCDSVSVENAGGVDANNFWFSRLDLPDICIVGPHTAGNSLQTYASCCFNFYLQCEATVTSICDSGLPPPTACRLKAQLLARTSCLQESVLYRVCG